MSKGIVNLSKSMLEIMEVVADEYGMEILDLKCKSKESQFIWPRHLAMYMCYQAGYTSRHIGKAFDRSRHMATHANKSVDTLCSVYPKLNKERIRIAKLLDILE